MFNKMIFILCILLASMGCERPAGESSAITINLISFGAEEFEQAYQRSSYTRENSAQGRKDFLENYIDSKLILLAAEKQGLDKDKKFLNDVEFFWQQSLMKLMLERKSQEIAKKVVINDRQIEEYYIAQREKYFPNQTLDEVRDQIRSVLLRDKQKEALGAWLDSLRQQANVKINKDLLGL